MAFINLPPSLQGIISGIENRLAKLELGRRFTFPNVASDPANPRNGDAWLNTTSNTPKYVDATGAVSTFGGGGGSSSTVAIKPVSGYYYSWLPNDTVSGSAWASANGTVYAQPFSIGTSATATRIAVNVQLGSASAVIRLGIYNNDATSDKPGTRLLDAGTVSVATSGWKAITISQALTAGTYWLVALQIAGSSGGQFDPATTGYSFTGQLPYGTTASPSNSYATGFTMSGQTGLPATYLYTGTALLVPTIWLGF